MAAAFGARFAAQHFDLLARTGDGNAVPRPQRERSASPTLAELRAAAEAGSPLVREETPDSDVEREKEAEAERLRVEAEEEAARCVLALCVPRIPPVRWYTPSLRK